MQALYKGKHFDSISGRVRRKRICHYPASVSAGSSRQVTYFEVSKASVAAAGTILVWHCQTLGLDRAADQGSGDPSIQ